MMNGALKGEPAINFHPPSNKWLRGTKGAGATGPGLMTYKSGDLNTPKAGDPAQPNQNKPNDKNKNKNQNTKPGTNKPDAAKPEETTTDPANPAA
jgi:hypothetical protein